MEKHTFISEKQEDYISRRIREVENQIIANDQKKNHLLIDLGNLKRQELANKGRKSTLREDIRAALRRIL